MISFILMVGSFALNLLVPALLCLIAYLLLQIMNGFGALLASEKLKSKQHKELMEKLDAVLGEKVSDA